MQKPDLNLLKWGIHAIFALFLFLFLFAMLQRGQDAYRQSKVADRYEPVAAQVISSTLSKHWRSGYKTSGGYSYQAEVTYTYRHADQNREGRTIYHGYEPGVREIAEDWLKRFPEGLQTTAYVDPLEPGRATLVSGLQTWNESNLLVLAMNIVIVSGTGLWLAIEWGRWCRQKFGATQHAKPPLWSRAPLGLPGFTYSASWGLVAIFASWYQHDERSPEGYLLGWLKWYPVWILACIVISVTIQLDRRKVIRFF